MTTARTRPSSVAIAITTGRANWSIWTSCLMPGLRIGRQARRIALSVFTLTWAKLCRSLEMIAGADADRPLRFALHDWAVGIVAGQLLYDGKAADENVLGIPVRRAGMHAGFQQPARTRREHRQPGLRRLISRHAEPSVAVCRVRDGQLRADRNIQLFRHDRQVIVERHQANEAILAVGHGLADRGCELEGPGPKRRKQTRG